MEVILYQSHALDIQIPPEGWVFDRYVFGVQSYRTSGHRCSPTDVQDEIRLTAGKLT